MLSLHLNVNTKHYSPRQKLFWFITLRLGRKYYEGIAGSRKWSSYFALDSRTFNCLQMVSKFIFACFLELMKIVKTLLCPSSNFQERNYVKCISWLLLRASMIFIFTKVAEIEKTNNYKLQDPLKYLFIWNYLTLMSPISSPQRYQWPNDEISTNI